MSALSPWRRRLVEACLEAAAALRDPRTNPDRIVSGLVIELTRPNNRPRVARRRLFRRRGTAALVAAFCLLGGAGVARAQGAGWSDRDGAWALPVTGHRVIDGDTVELTVALPWELRRVVRLRLEGIDAAETNAADPRLRAHGLAAKEFAAAWLARCDGATALISGLDRYGRDLGDLECETPESRLARALVAAHLAVPYTGGNRAALVEEHLENARVRAARKDGR